MRNKLPIGFQTVEFAMLIENWLIAAAALLSGCATIGPTTVAMDRFDFSTSIADSWKQQTLLNIVKVRYMDMPVFVDVASIVAGYSMETGVTSAAVLLGPRARQNNNTRWEVRPSTPTGRPSRTCR